MVDAKLTFSQVLEALLDLSQPFPNQHLPHFSDIDTDELEALLEVWSHIEPGRKQQLLSDLDQLAEEDTLVSFDNLARALLTDDDPQVRELSIRLLDECEDTKLAPTFVRILSGDENNDVRAAAATALGMFVEKGELEEIPAETHRAVENALLLAAGGQEHPEVQRRALESLGYSSRTEVAGLLESAYQRPEPAWIASALFAMGRSYDRRWADHVLSMLPNDDQRIRLAAVEAAGELGLPSARTILLRMLEEEDDDLVFGALVWSLSQIGGEDVRTYLVSLLDQYEEEDQISYIEDALANLDFTEGLNEFDLIAFDADDELELPEE